MSTPELQGEQVLLLGLQLKVQRDQALGQSEAEELNLRPLDSAGTPQKARFVSEQMGVYIFSEEEYP